MSVMMYSGALGGQGWEQAILIFTEKCELNRKLNVFCPQSMKILLS